MIIYKRLPILRVCFYFSGSKCYLPDVTYPNERWCVHSYTVLLEGILWNGWL